MRIEDGFRYREIRIARWLLERELEVQRPRKRSRRVSAIQWHIDKVEDKLDAFIAEHGHGRHTLYVKRTIARMKADIAERKARMKAVEQRERQRDAEAEEARLREILHEVRLGSWPLAEIEEAKKAVTRAPRHDKGLPRVGDDV